MLAKDTRASVATAAMALITGIMVALVLGSGVALAQVISCKTSAVCNGTPHNDTMTGTALSNDMRGLAGEDVLRARGGGDVLNGGRGKDLLDGGSDGDDSYTFGNDWGTDKIADASGIDDALSFSGLTSPVTVQLFPDPFFNEAKSGQNKLNFPNTVVIENVSGGTANDVISGNDQDNTLSGGFGDDRLDGGAGADLLLGGRGFDEINANTGADSVFAGAEDDTILASDFEADQIDCGDGFDTVFFNADRDFVDANCENRNP
jgi:Ca2+-binding RTX toxin-like protein